MSPLVLVITVFLKVIAECVVTRNRECYHLMSRGHCDYYKCFNEIHHHCQLDFGFEYCDRFDHHSESMSNEGKRWLNVSRVCAMEQMWELEADGLSCSAIDYRLRNLHERCEIEAGLCTSVLWNDRSIFIDVKNLRTGTIYFKHALRGCPAEIMRRFVDWVKESGAIEWLESAKDTITNAVDGILEYFE